MAERSPELGPEMGCRDGDPTGKTRHLACEEFASVASCDASVARRYLAENDWEMQRALNAYFERPVEEGALQRRPESEPGSWS